MYAILTYDNADQMLTAVSYQDGTTMLFDDADKAENYREEIDSFGNCFVIEIPVLGKLILAGNK